MFVYGGIKRFVAKILIGLVLILLSGLIFFAFWENTSNLNNFKTFPAELYYNNTAFYYYIFFTNFILIFFGIIAYLIPFFLFVYGLRILLGIISSFIILRLFLLILSIVLINLVIVLGGFFGKGIIANMLLNILPYNLNIYLENIFITWLIMLVLTLIAVITTLVSFSIKFKYLFKINFFSFAAIKYFFKTLFLIKYFLPKIKLNKKNDTFPRNILKKSKQKSEPTLKKFINKKTLRRDVGLKPFDELNDIHYKLPSVELLKLPKETLQTSKELDKKNIEFSKRLEQILSEYGVEGKIVNFKCGPVVTLYEFLPAAGVKTSKVVSLSDDITRAMSSLSTRISSQPGKTSIGIEIPNTKRENVLLGELVNDDFFISEQGLILALGKNISGEKKFTDLEKMPHLLIAGTTGSGKSVGINSMIISLLLKFTPSECKLILIDPKMLELSVYEDIPHLLTPVVTNPSKAVFALKWVVREMENRYRLMSSLNVKNISSFNNKISQTISSGRKLYREVQTGVDKDTRMPIIEKKEIPLETMPLIVVVIDEMADLMMVAGKEVENLVQRLAQMARASGIHLIAATQRPSVDVITGTIKANFPSRISFKVASRFDSRTILNEMGAEQLLGSGDMLFLENGANLTRLHGGFVSEEEIESIVKHIKLQSSSEKLQDITIEDEKVDNYLDLGFSNKDVDELYEKAVSIVVDQQKVSTSFIQRYLQIGYNRAARIVEQMEEDGIISEANNAGKRTVLKK